MALAALGGLVRAGDLCLSEEEQWKICLVGTPIATSWSAALTSCKIELRISNVESSCPGYSKLTKYFTAAENAGNCLTGKLGLTEANQVTWYSEHLPIEILESLDFDAVETCAKEALTAKVEEIKSCGYTKTQRKAIRASYKEFAYLKCSYDQFKTACATHTQTVLNTVMEGLQTMSIENTLG